MCPARRQAAGPPAHETCPGKDIAGRASQKSASRAHFGPATNGTFRTKTGQAACPMTHANEPHRLIQLLERIAQGERPALTELHDATANRLYVLALMLVATPPWAEQVLQACYVRVWQQARHYRRTTGPAIDWMAMLLRQCAQHLLQGRAGEQARQAQALNQLLDAPREPAHSTALAYNPAPPPSEAASAQPEAARHAPPKRPRRLRLSRQTA